MNDLSPDLLDRCRRRDERAWAELVDRYSGLVYSIGRSCGLSSEQCDDVAQTVFANLARTIESIREPGALPAWLGTSTRRECWRIRKRQKRQRTNDPVMAERQELSQIEEISERIERAHAVRLGLEELGGRCQQLLMRIFGASGEPDYKSIGEELGMPIGSIGPTRARCLAKLAEILKGGRLGRELSGESVGDADEED